MEARVDEGLRTETLGRGEAIVDIATVRIESNRVSRNVNGRVQDVMFAAYRGVWER
jgi:hypothetical protein